jgi:predicted MFS family arabinose efflux permease
MPAPYAVLGENDTTNLYTIFKFVNNGVGGIFMPLLLLGIWIIAFIGSISEGRQASRAWVFASFVCSILGIIMALLGMLATQFMYFAFIMTGVGIIWNYLENSPGS